MQEDTDFEKYLSISVEDEDFINWNDFVLPHDYGDAEAEYHSIRNSCAIFDVSPLRKYRIRGADSGAFLDRLLTRPASTAPSMRGIYVAFCNEDGTLKDDAILHKYADDDYLLLPSDMDHSAHFQSLVRELGIQDISINDCTAEWVGLAVQGPSSALVLNSMGLEGIEQLEPMAIRDYSLDDLDLRVARMGFTADLGYELWCRAAASDALAQAIGSVRESLGAGIPGYGLTALQACRLEGGFIVAGWDCASEADPSPGFERTPYELRLGWLVDLGAEDFVGRDALQSQKDSGPRYSLRNFQIDDRRQPDDGAELIATIDGREQSIGLITCSAWSWDLGRMIGNASVRAEYAGLETAWAKVEGERLELVLGKGPLRSFERCRQVPAPMAS